MPKITNRWQAVSATLLALLAFDAAAARAQSYVVQGGAGWRPMTGVAGESTDTFSAPSGKVLASIGFAERQDRPCGMVFTFYGQGSGSTARFEGCSSPVGPSIGNWARNGKTVDVHSSPDAPRGIRQVRVCTRSGNQRMKGLRIRGAAIHSGGTQNDPGLYQEEDRPNCNDNWSPNISQCPAGQVATRVRVEHREDGDHSSIVGLSLFCSRVRTTS